MDPTVTPMPISSVLDAATDVVEEGLNWVSKTADTVTSTPLILMFCVVGFIGTGISLLRRLIG